MRFILKAVAAGAVCASFLASCFKDEAPNAECDILRASVSVAAPDEVFFNLSDSAVAVLSTDSTVTFNVRKNANLSALAPEFTITPGATIEPASGSVHDFSSGAVTYTVTSEDKAWHREYRVAFNRVSKTVGDTMRLDFENYSLESSGHYYVWQRTLDDGTLSGDWASGNAGFQLSMGNAKPDEYPTVPLAEGYDGYGVKLVTRSTGMFGVIANKRLAAGNMFLGTFNLDSALVNALHATRFGVPCESRPVKITGYYKYQPGDKFQDRSGKYLDNTTDSAAIYAVFYRNHDSQGNAVTLYGDNVKTSPQIVAIADMHYVAPTSIWTPFEITFDYRAEVSDELLESRGCNITVVFSSSKGGDDFCGAVGSTLCVDKVRVISTKED
jgi:hypothetical protein